LFYEEWEDPDIIRVGDDYYLAGTTMHMNPAVQIMHSKDLVNWELAGYCMDRLDLGPAFRLEGGNIYGRGLWAPCLRYHQGIFYLFSNVNGAGLQVFRSKSIDGPLGAQPTARKARPFGPLRSFNTPFATDTGPKTFNLVDRF
jgi:xylan 1,4-beta-xylosidase